MIVDAYIENKSGGYFSYIVPEKLKSRIIPYIRVEVPFRNHKEIALVIHSVSKREYGLDFSHLESIHKVIDDIPLLTEEQIHLAHRLADFYFMDPSVFLFQMLPSARREYSDSVENIDETDAKWFSLNSSQKNFLEKFNENVKKNPNGYTVHLLHGITGSGKTRVYIELIQEKLSQNQGVILLLPEIALASQIAEIIASYFPKECAVYHSQKTKGSRLEIYKSVLKGEKKLIIGTRSSVFLPVKNLNLIIIDEEQDASYKESRIPHYHARVVAGIRMKEISSFERQSTQLLLGSATPSIETYFRATETKKIFYYTIKERATAIRLPEVSVIDTSGFGKELISFPMKLKMEEHLKNGNSILLLINRRGHSRIARCKDCREVVICTECSVPLTYHKSGIMKCHLCGKEISFRESCGICGGEMQLYGAGTQKIEDYLEKHFPNIAYGRLDRDSSQIKGHADDVIHAIQTGKIRILIGTQMIAKGFDIEKVTLMGILDGDIGLNLPDYRSGERVFQLIVQAAGRSGRHQAGEVVVQTSFRDHPAIQYGTLQDYEAFAKHELMIRRMADYPPFTHIIRILSKGEDLRALKAYMEKIKQTIFLQSSHSDLFSEKNEKETENLEVLGPVPAPFEKIKGQYRYHLLIKDYKLRWSRKYFKKVLHSIEKLKTRYPNIRFEFDVDPLDIL